MRHSELRIKMCKTVLRVTIQPYRVHETKSCAFDWRKGLITFIREQTTFQEIHPVISAGEPLKRPWNRALRHFISFHQRRSKTNYPDSDRFRLITHKTRALHGHFLLHFSAIRWQFQNDNVRSMVEEKKIATPSVYRVSIGQNIEDGHGGKKESDEHIFLSFFLFYCQLMIGKEYFNIRLFKKLPYIGLNLILS